MLCGTPNLSVNASLSWFGPVGRARNPHGHHRADLFRRTQKVRHVCPVTLPQMAHMSDVYAWDDTLAFFAQQTTDLVDSGSLLSRRASVTGSKVIKFFIAVLDRLHPIIVVVHGNVSRPGAMGLLRRSLRHPRPIWA